MNLSNYDSLCKKTATRIVSKDRGSRRKHIALNDNCNNVSPYRVDGYLVTQGKRCDFLLLNETKMTAYLIELKGKDITQAISQLKAAQISLKTEIKAYEPIHYRIVASTCRTHQIKSSTYQGFKRIHKHRFKVEEALMEEHI